MVARQFEPGDFLIFQLESGYALLRVLAVDDLGGDVVWHVSAYGDFYPDVESAEEAINADSVISLANPHIAMTNHAFEATQVARIGHRQLTETEIEPLIDWRASPDAPVADRSVRLLLGFR